MPFSRYGLREGFENVELKKVHDVSTKFMEETPVNVYENVPAYEEAGEPGDHDATLDLFDRDRNT